MPLMLLVRRLLVISRLCVCLLAGNGEGYQPPAAEAAVLRRPGGPVVYGGPGEEGGHPLQGKKQAEKALMYVIG